MSQQQNTEQRHDARDLWRQGRKRSDTSAVFRPSDELRCPGWLQYPGYNGPCGCSWGEYANPHTRVIIRVLAYTRVLRRVDENRRAEASGSREPNPGTIMPCHKCGASLEKLTILEASE